MKVTDTWAELGVYAPGHGSKTIEMIEACDYNLMATEILQLAEYEESWDERLENTELFIDVWNEYGEENAPAPDNKPLIHLRRDAGGKFRTVVLAAVVRAMADEQIVKLLERRM